MLVHLQIRNFALIDALDLEFGPGLLVLSGETGAGKSIVIDALGLALGNRASRDMIRQGAEAASIQAAFFISPGSPLAGEDSPLRQALAAVGLESAFPGEDELLILRREVSRNGPTRCWVNGQLVTVAQLQQVAGALVEIHGQHDQQTLLSPREQLRVLDQYGQGETGPLLSAYREAYGRWRALQRELDSLALDEAERARRIDLLRYQVDEIGRAEIEAGEDGRLEEERQILAHAERLGEAVEEAYALLHGGGQHPAASDGLAQALVLLQRAGQTDPRLQPLVESLEEALVRLEESRQSLRQYLDGLDADPARLAWVEERLALLQELKRKYGPTLEEVLVFKEQAAAELEGLETYDERLAQQKAALAEAEEALADAAARLTACRRRWAEVLGGAIQKELEGLRLGDPRLEVRVEDGQEPQPTGTDRVTWLFSANPGEPLQPLHRVASGGELSRVMLAVKAVLAAVDQVPTMIFDEVDAGIGGETAVAVGERLTRLARHRQVLCITHLPQIASLADQHFAVHKQADGGRTYVTVRPVAGEERVRELARMLGGSGEQATLEHARRLLARREAEPPRQKGGR